MTLAGAGDPERPEPPPQAAASPSSPFRYPVFAVLWSATVVSNVGSWMYNAAAGWLMISLDANPLMVSLVQVAANLPMFLFAVPAGALGDIIDKRKLLIIIEVAIAAVSTIFAGLVWLSVVTPGALLFFMFLIGVGGALTAPAWQSIVPSLVPRQSLPAAVAANSVGINISRAVGPALGGILIAALGVSAPFWINGISNVGTIGALIWWRSPPTNPSRLPVERFASAIRTGFRYARNNASLRATLARAVAFFLFASAYWALLPLVAES